MPYGQPLMMAALKPDIDDEELSGCLLEAMNSERKIKWEVTPRTKIFRNDLGISTTSIHTTFKTFNNKTGKN